MIAELSSAVISRLRRLRDGARTPPSPTFETQGLLRPAKAARLTRLRLAVISLVLIVVAMLAAIGQSNLVQARLAERGVSQLHYLISSLTPQTDKTPSQLGQPQGSQETASPLSPLGYSATLTGPILPPSMPFGATHVTGDPGNTGLIGRAGGNTWYFFNVNLPAACGNTTYWGPQNNLVRLSFINSSFLNTSGEVLTFQPAQSNLPAGIAVWTGFTINPSSGQTVFTRFTMTANLHSGAAPGGAVGAAIPLTDPTTVGLAPNIGALVPVTAGINYQINMRFDASFTNGSGYSPALDFYDVNSTAGGTCFESFTAGFYYYNFLPTISDIANQTTLVGVPSGPHAFTVGDCEISPASLSVSGTSSNPTLVPNANLSFGGGGSSRNVLVTPAAGESGTTTITVSVSDGLNTTSDTFDLLVDAPPAWVTTGGTVDEPTGSEANPIQRSLNLSLDDPDSSQVLTFSLAGGTGYCGASPTHPFTGLAFSPPTTPTVAGNEATSLLFSVGANDAAASLYCIRVIADDGFTNSSQDLTIAVTQQNSDPEWFTTAGTVDEPIGNDADPIGRTISLSLNDPDDSQTLSFTLAGGTGDCGAPGTHPFTGLSFDPASTPTVSGNESTLLHLNVGANAAPNSPYCVRLTAGDGTSTSDRDLSVTVTPQNSNPTISDVTNQLTQRNQATSAIPITVGDIDADDPPGALIMSGTSSDTVLVPNANIVFGGSGASRDVTITPANNQTGTTTITLTVTDTHGGTASDTFDLRVNAVPVFSTNTGLILDQGATATITNAMLTVTDADNTAAQLKYTIASPPNGGPPHQGTLKLNNVALSSGSFFTQDDVNNNRVSYTHDDSNNTTDDFQFDITDGDGATLPNDGVHLSFSFSISITLINHAPVAVAGNGTTGIGAPFNGTFAATDRDLPAQTLTRRIVTNGTKGLAVLGDATTGAFTYTPNPGEAGQDTIVFQVNDGSLDSVNPGTFTIDIQNQPPTAQNGSGNTNEGVALDGTLIATDPDQPPQVLTFAIAGNPTKGNVNITDTATGAFTYTPNANAFGADSFTFTADDGLLTSAPGTFSINIHPNPDAGDIFVTNTTSTETGPVGSVIQIDPNNGMQSLVTTGGNLTNPSAIIIEHDGNLVVLNKNGGAFSLVRIDPATGAQTVIPAGPTYGNPVGLGIGSGTDLFVADPFASGPGAGAVFEVNATTGALVHTFSGGNLHAPVGLAFDIDGNLLVSDGAAVFGGTSTMIRINTATDAQTVVSSGGNLMLPVDIAIDSNQQIIVSDSVNLFGPPANAELIRVDPITGAQTVIVGTGLGKASGVAVDYPTNNSFTPDNGGAAVLKTTPGGTTSTISSGGALTNPFGIAMIQNFTPVAAHAPVTVHANSPVGITLEGRDVETYVQTLDETHYSYSAPSHGLLTGTAPNLTYWANSGYAGVDSFTYAITDNAFGLAPAKTSNVATVSITVNCQPNQPPVAVPGGPYVADLHSSVSFDGSGSYDVDNLCGDSITQYSWSIDSGAVALSGGNPTLSAAQVDGLGVGSHGLTLTVEDSFGSQRSASTTLNIYDNRPFASFTANPNPAACTQSISFNASASSHGRPDRSIVSYSWDFGDGNTGSGVLVTHSYAAFASYTVTLTVTDNNVPAKTANASIVVAVNQGNQPPVSVPGGPYTADLGSGVTLDSSGSSDPNAGCGDSIVSYEWDIDNDGTFEATGVSVSLSAAQVSALGVGAHTVTLRVTDEFGAVGTGNGTLNIYDNRPFASFTASPNPAACSQSISLNGSASSHGRPDRSIVSYVWDFGDGNVGSGVAVTHAYSAYGTYTARLTVTDNNVPAKTDFVTHSVTVNQGNQAPVSVPGGPYSTTVGSGISLNGSGSSDPNASCGDSIVQYNWSIDSGAVTASGANPSLPWAQISVLGVGSHTVALTVTDTLGATGNASTTLAINPCPTTFTVNDNGDGSDANPGDGVCATSGNVCTLRAAIQEANALTSCGTIDINFSIGSATITLSNGQLTVDHDVNVNGPTVNQVVISGNNASRVFVVNSGRTVAISTMTISGGNSPSGSGIVNDGTLTLTNSTVNGNTASSGDGGGIDNTGTLTLANSRVSGNTGLSGGGIANVLGGTLTLTNSTVSGNISLAGNGGGIANFPGSTLTLTNSTVTGNTITGNGGGVFNNSGTVNVRNTIIAGNSASSTGPDISGSFTSQGNNLIGKSDGGSGFTNGVNGDIVGTIATPVDPLLGALMNNGGPTFTHGLLYNSPAVDAGNDCVFTNTCVPSVGTPLNFDQRGFPRQADGDLVAGAVVDMGAYERQASETRSFLPGSSIQVDLGDARLTFPSVTIPIEGGSANSPNLVGNTASLSVINPAGQPAPPIGYTVGTIPTPPGCATNASQAPCLPAFDVSTTAVYTPPVGICFYLPAITNATFFGGVKILHNEGGVLVDRTSTQNFSQKLVCGSVTTLSPFVLAFSNVPTAANGTVGGQITDSSGAPVEGVAIRLEGTQNRMTITDRQGNYHFDEVETNGFYTVTPSRANYVFSPAQRSFSQNGQHTEATFTATEAGSALNPLDTTEYFVRQQYLDFLSREPDEAGFNYWVRNIAACGTDSDCLAAKRTDTSAAFFLSIEFQQTGYLVHRMYQSAYGDMPGAPVPLGLGEFRPDKQAIGQGVVVNQSGWEAKLESNTQAFAAAFVGRARFTSVYPVTMTPTEFVDRLFTNGGVTPDGNDLAAAINEFGGAADTTDAAARARAVRRVAENATLRTQKFNQAFVLMQYFGYLGRDPNAAPDTDFSGYTFWLNKLDSFNGDFRAAEMVRAFLVAGEYRGRFPR